MISYVQIFVFKELGTFLNIYFKIKLLYIKYQINNNNDNIFL